jgi:hypothetical protein
MGRGIVFRCCGLLGHGLAAGGGRRSGRRGWGEGAQESGDSVVRRLAFQYGFLGVRGGGFSPEPRW